MKGRCGRCGMWSSYPKDHYEKKWAGVCLWLQIRLREEDVWEQRECADFFERIPGIDPMGQMDYKIKRDNLGEAYAVALRSKHLAYLGVIISIISLGLAVFRTIAT